MSFSNARRGGSRSGNELVAGCCQLLEIHRVFHYRNNSGAFKAAHGSFIRFGTPGSPDIVAVINGAYIGLECKMGTGKLNPNQKLFRENLERAGGRYFVIHTIEELQSALKDLGV